MTLSDHSNENEIKGLGLESMLISLGELLRSIEELPEVQGETS